MKRKWKLIFVTVCILLSIAVSSIIHTDISSEIKDESEVLDVYVIDVGQADSILVRNGAESVLIDAGNREDGDDIVKFLREQGVDHLDAIFLTHPHEDHIGGAPKVLNMIGADAVYMNKEDYDSNEIGKRTVEAVYKNAGTVITPACGETIAFDEMTFSVLGPIQYDPGNKNNNSIVTMMHYGDFTMLFSGDCEREEEADILSTGVPLKADILKSGHHGSETASTYPWLNEVLPEDVVISVGLANRYGLPDESVISKYRDADTDIYRTDEVGTIHITSDGRQYSILDKKGNILKSSVSNGPLNSNGQEIGSPVNSEVKAHDKIETKEKNETREEYIGNKNSLKFHLSSCEGLPKENNRVYFRTKEEAVKEGYSPCGMCNP